MGIDARMYVRVQRKVSDKEILRLSYEVGEAFGADRFFRYGGEHNISKLSKIEQDGPDVNPGPGETILEVHVWTRYYGIGYERGDLPFLLVLAEWLERKLPDGAVWYGGDSSGVCAAPFGKAARKKLLDHFASASGRDYYKSFSGDLVGAECPLCKVAMQQFGYGPGPRAGSFVCHGCGYKVSTVDGGSTFTPYKEE